MLKLNAIFHRKEPHLNIKSCVVEKIIPLTGFEFDRFSSNMMRDWEFIADNIDLMYVDSSDAHHCLLVTGEGRENGILVESEGAEYARYAAHVPHVHSVIASQNQSPALSALGGKLISLVEDLADEYLTLLEKDDRAAIPLHSEAEVHGVDISRSDILRDTIIKMLGERLADHNLDMEYDNGDLILSHAPALEEQEMSEEPDIKLEM